MSKENLELWDSVEQTDPSFTKDFSGKGGFSGTAINPMYLTKKATEQFGPIGIGWGYEIVEERFDTGAPMGVNADGIELREMVHTILLKLWYKLPGHDERGEVSNYGHTQFVYSTRNSGFRTDSEFGKKSLTDAIGKCLSMIGFSSDVFMGLFDDVDYKEEARLEQSIKNAEESEVEMLEERKKFGEWAEKELKNYEKIPNIAALNLTYKTHLRNVERKCQILKINFHAAREKFDAAFKENEERLGVLGVVCQECGNVSKGSVGAPCKEDGCNGKLVKIEGDKK